ncbi:MAG: M28 family peptidase [Acidobacteria bacterium]|nr:M28 family peptidase [Acidobacteriota bacterium]
MASVFDEDLSSEAVRDLTSSFCSEFPERMAGGPGEEGAARAAAELFREAGLDDVRVEEIDLEVFRARSWEVRDERGREMVARPLLGVPPCDGLDIEVVDVGLGREEDYERLRAGGTQLDGTAHLARRGGNGPGTGECDRFEKLHNAKAAGAAAFLYQMDVAFGPAGWLPGDAAPPALECGLGDLYPSIPAVTLAAGEAPERVRLTVGSVEERGTTWLVRGALAGATDEEVILGAQLDAVEEARYGAPYDNGAGVAAVALLARALARSEGRRRTLTVCAFGAEEPGTIASRYLAAERLDDPERTVAMVNLDSFTHRDGWLGLSSYTRGAMGEGDFSRGAPYGGTADTHVEGSLARRLASKLEQVGYRAERTYLTGRAEWTSDHYPFAIVGIPSVWAFKKPVLFHCEYDVLAGMDWDDASLIARAHGLLLEDLLAG